MMIANIINSSFVCDKQSVCELCVCVYECVKVEEGQGNLTLSVPLRGSLGQIGHADTVGCVRAYPETVGVFW